LAPYTASILIEAEPVEKLQAGYPTLSFTPASAKQRPRTSMGGLQSVLNFRFGVFRAGTCTGALSSA
jgi:hypothetical protein